MGITLNRKFLAGFVEDKDLEALKNRIDEVHQSLVKRSGKGSEFLGWTDLPGKVDDSFIEELVELGKEVRSHSDVIISIGIGGSYLGIRSSIEFLGGSAIPILYAGNNMSADYMYHLIESVKDKNITAVVISKSGTTTEPALAFRLIKKVMKEKYSDAEIKKRIICVTDQAKGALRAIADKEGYRAYNIPDDVGGRFSILTPVGLVPLALAGIDIKSLIDGAREGEKEFAEPNLSKNICYQYALCRFLLYQQGKKIEVTSSFYDNLQYVNEWWKQLFGESEGKDQKGIFPASLILSTDLHSMGQLMQDGERTIFETFIQIDEANHTVIIPEDEENLDQFNIVAGKNLDWVNKKAYQATAEAHFEGGVPNMTITLSKSDAYHLGMLYYFYERAVAISGYLLDVNPFDQPGVEAYKKKMFALLGKA